MTIDKTTFSVNLDELTIDQLVQVNQGLGRQVDKLREQRAYINAKIAQRLAAGERNGEASAATTEALPEGAAPASGDATAQGAVIETKVE